jgi:type IV pilus assembly protein PilV
MMKRSTRKCRLFARNHAQRGFSLIEMLLAMLVLTIGMLGGAIMITVAVASNANSKFDTGAVSLAQSTMDRIIVISANASGTNLNTNMTDCNGTVHPVFTAAGPGGTAAGAPTTTINGIATGTQVIDFSQAAVPNYQMNYVLCGAGGAGNTGIPQVYDVRWNVGPGPTQTTQLILVAAKNISESGNGTSQTKYFSMPITLRALRGY